MESLWLVACFSKKKTESSSSCSSIKKKSTREKVCSCEEMAELSLSWEYR